MTPSTERRRIALQSHATDASDRQATHSRAWTWPAAVFLATFLILLALTPHFVAELDPPTGDEPYYLQMSMSLLDDRDIEMTNNYAKMDYLDFYPKVTARPPFRGWEDFPVDLPPHESTTARPGLYEKHGAGLAALIAPAYRLGGRLGTVIFINFLAALLAANVFLLAREVSGSLKASLFVTLGLSFSSPLLPYGFLIFPAIPAALMLAYAFRRARSSPINNRWQAAGLALSMAFLPWLHAGYALLSIPIFAYYLYQIRRTRSGIMTVLPVVAVSGVLFIFYYYYLYGTIIPNYGDHAGFYFPLGTLQGLLGLAVDQQWGLVTYSPFYLVPVAGIFLMWWKRRTDLFWILLAGAPAAVFFASYGQWWGEWCPPARYLVPVLPLAAAPAAVLIKQAGVAARCVSGILLSTSLFLVSSFVAAPKLMYNHPTGESRLFLDLAGQIGLDLTRWLPSLVNPGADIFGQTALALAGTVSVVIMLLVWRPRRRVFAVASADAFAKARGLAVRNPWVTTLLALALILLIGSYFRFNGVDWDSGQHLHPDERFITMVATDIELPASITEYFDSASSPLNPNNRNFRSYPYGTSFLFLAKFLAAPSGMDGYDNLAILGRVLSALADLSTVVLVFLLGRRLYNRWAGLLAALLYAAAVLPIQHSHFFVAESFTTFFVMLTLLLAARVSSGAGWPSYAAMGVSCGLALGSKVSVALLIPIMALAAGIVYWKHRDARPVIGLGLALLAMVVAFRIAQPYAFAGGWFFDLRPSPLFWGAIEEQRRMAEGSVELPYTIQYAGTVPYLFHLQNLFWGLGPALLVAAIGGLGLVSYELVRGRRLEHLLIIAWAALAFAYFGGQYVKYMRYLLPVYPVLALAAGYLVWRLIDYARRPAAWWRSPRALSAGAGILVVIAGSLLWAWAYTRIYEQPLTRIEASRWIYQNVPAGSAVGVEHWDDPLPLNIRDSAAQQYRQVSLELYHDDNPAKLETLVTQLAQMDYIFISSNRLYGSIPRLPLRYPMTTEYYRLLFSGELGFDLASVFDSYPTLGPWRLVDDTADESFTVYDHPKVQIFKKSASFSRERVRGLLSAVPLDNVVRQGARSPANYGLFMAPDLTQENRAGGTWSEVFDPGGLPARFPFASWYLLIQVLSLAALPLGMAAFRALPDRGYPLLKSMGVLIVSYLAWMLASMRIAPYTRAAILWIIAAALLGSVVVAWRRRDLIRQALRDNWRVMLTTEALFFAAFLAFYLVRMANPDLWHPFRGGEKPMDFAYLNAVVKTTYFPPYDPWFSGGYINYYYFGQVLVATLTKITAIPTAVTYNLAVPLFFALTVVGAFSAGFNLSGMAVRRRSFVLSATAGLTAAVFVAVIGNLDGLVQLVQGLWKISPAPIESPLPGVAGFVNAWSGFGERFAGRSLPQFDFWRSSRMMTPTFSITEFPYFTFLFADLHAHLVGLPFTLLALGSILSLAARKDAGRLSYFGRAAVAALCLGALWVTNSWDFPIYFLLAAAILVLFGARRPLNWSSLAVGLAMAAGLFLAAFALFYPFHSYYQQFYAGVNPSPEKTPLHQYLAVHGLFIVIIGAYLLSRAVDGIKRARGGKFWAVLGAIWLTGLFAGLLVSDLVTAAFLIVLLGLSLLALLAARDRSSMVAVILIIAAVLMGLGVEFITIKGDIQRMNTVFKFYLQAWVLLAVASTYCLFVLVRIWTRGRLRWPAYLWGPLAIIGVWGSLLYPMGATPMRVADRFADLPPSDNGMAFMQHASYGDEKGTLDLSLDYRAISWMQENIPGSPVVLEGNTPLYRWGSRVSVYTGLPTVIGWDWHQKQQRAAYDVMVETRLTDVRTMYSTGDTATLVRLLKKYGVSYVYVGQLERQYYPSSGIDKFESLDGSALRRIYQDGPVSIYEVRPGQG